MHLIKIEQVNVSDDEYKLVEFVLDDGEPVTKGAHILSYESSKTINEYEAPNSGFFYSNPNLKIDEFYSVGTKIGVIAEEKLSAEDVLALFEEKKQESINETKITRKARLLIEEHKIEESLFSHLELVTEDDVKGYIAKNDRVDNIADFSDIKPIGLLENASPKRLAVVGAGKAALQLHDAVQSNNDHIITVFYETSNEYALETLLNIPVKKIDNLDTIKSDFENNAFDEVVVSFTGDVKSRTEIFNQLLDACIPIPNIIHKTAHISEFVTLGVGNLIYSNVRIGPFTKIGNNNIFSAYCNIEHNNCLGDGNTFGPNVVFSGSCRVGNMNKFGTMIGIEPRISIGSNSIIGSGVILTRNITDNILVRNLSKFEIIDRS